MRAFIALIVASALSNGCLVLSLQPAYDDESVVFDERLIGQWENPEDGTAATINRAEWRSYKVIYTAHSATTALHANLTSVGQSLFLDLTDTRGSDVGPYLLPVHGIFRIDLTGDTLTASGLDYAWFGRAMAQKTLRRLTIALDGRRNAVIASPTSDLRAWLARAPEGAFGAPMTFIRKRE